MRLKDAIKMRSHIVIMERWHNSDGLYIELRNNQFHITWSEDIHDASNERRLFLSIDAGSMFELFDRIKKKEYRNGVMIDLVHPLRDGRENCLCDTKFLGIGWTNGAGPDHNKCRVQLHCLSSNTKIDMHNSTFHHLVRAMDCIMSWRKERFYHALWQDFVATFIHRVKFTVWESPSYCKK